MLPRTAHTHTHTHTQNHTHTHTYTHHLSHAETITQSQNHTTIHAQRRCVLTKEGNTVTSSAVSVMRCARVCWIGESFAVVCRERLVCTSQRCSARRDASTMDPPRPEDTSPLCLLTMPLLRALRRPLARHERRPTRRKSKHQIPQFALI